jgi:protein subunit release factor B
MDDKAPLISVTAADCTWSYTKGSGPGGQKKNKTSSAVHCKHEPSGGHGYAEDTRSQHENKRLAFTRMVKSQDFQDWLNFETLRRLGKIDEIERYVRKEMEKVKVETKDNGIWVEIKKDLPLE